MFVTIAGSFCAEPVNVEVNTAKSVKEAQHQKRSILSDCDGPIGGIGAIGGIHSDIGLSGDLALGSGYASGYASGYTSGYSPSYSGGYLASSGILGSVGHIGAVGAAVVAPSPIISSGYASGYAAHAPVYASSVIAAPAPVVAAPAVCHSLSNSCFIEICAMQNDRLTHYSF